MPLQRRVPKRGFKNINRKEYKVFNLGRIEELVKKYKLKTFDHASLYEHRLVKKGEIIKVLGRGELKTKIDFTLHAVSKNAKEAIEKVGGKISLVE